MNLVQSIQISYEPGCYVLDGCLCNGGSSLAVAASNQTIRLYDLQSTRFLFELREHTQPIRDVVATAAAPSLLFSAQEDTGVMVTDVRVGKAVHFITDGCGSGATCNSVSVSPAGDRLALAVDSDVALIDARTWGRTHALADMHIDEVTRVRFVDPRVVCSGSEDQMVNFMDSTAGVDDDDVLLQSINAGEVMTRITHFPTLEVTAMVGSCENGLLCPADLEKAEVRYPRPDYQRYLLDWCEVGGELFLVSGTRDDDGNATGLRLLHWATRAEVPLLPAAAHREIGRIALGFGDRLITGGEDGVVCVWARGDAATALAPAPASLSSSARGNATRERAPHPGAEAGQQQQQNHQQQQHQQRSAHLHAGRGAGGGAGGGGRGYGGGGNRQQQHPRRGGKPY